MSLTLRAIELRDLDAVARIHCLAFPQGALVSLGAEAVRRYYHWQLVGPHDAVAVAAFEADRMLGFCFAGVFRGALSGFLRAHRGFLLCRVIGRPWLLRDPIFRRRLHPGLRALGWFRRTPPPRAASGAGARPFGVLAIAVHPDFAGRGVGGQLMDFVEAAARRRGFTAMTLTVEPRNESALCFYEHLGWRRARDGGEWSGVMRKLIRSREGVSAAPGEDEPVRSDYSGVRG